MIWLSSATAEASSLGLGHFNFVTVQRSDTMSQPALMEFMELSREWDSFVLCICLENPTQLPINLTKTCYASSLEMAAII